MAGIITLFFHASTAQNNWEVQFRPGLDFTTEDFADSNIKTGFGFELTAAYHFTPQIGVYGGWGWNEFRADDPLGNSKFDVEEKGYSLGLQYKFPVPNSPMSYFVQGGAIYNHFELQDLKGNVMQDSGHGMGFQAGAGLELGIGGDFNLRPTIRYRSFTRPIRQVNGSYDATLSYISIGIGLIKTF